MKLRHRFAITFAIASLGTLLFARFTTIVSFTRLQQYKLDEGLRARAREEGNDVALVGRKALELEYAAKEEADPLEYLVTYGALYRADGTLVADTPSFAHAPPLEEIGSHPPGSCFDFVFRGKTLRGTLTEVTPSDQPSERLYLLLAASRKEMDDDARQLLAVGWWVVLACMPAAMFLGWLLGRRMTRGIETLATSARRVTAGELDLEVAPDASRDEEVAALGRTLREMVARLKALIETERRFASHAAHELRSPLAALRGEIELALRRRRSAAEYEATLRDALEDTERLVELAEDLLVVARLESGASDDREEEADVEGLVREAIETSAGGAPSDIAFQIEGGPFVVRGARVALVRMLRNLIDNAVVHGEKDVRIRVRPADDGLSVRIEVEDDGAGIDAKERERIFEPFHRGADARERSGAGLGLGIAREIAKRHGGRVTLESPSRPTRFVVTLPIVTVVPSPQL